MGGEGPARPATARARQGRGYRDPRRPCRSLHAGGQDIARSEGGRLALEAIWVPSTLLPQRGVTWRVDGDDSATAHITINGEAIDLTLYVDRVGALRKVSLMRWGPTDNGGYAYRPFTGWVAAEGTFGGYTIPVSVRASWGDGGADTFEFYRANVESAVYP